MKNVDINGLKVAAPCSMAWDTMTGDERKRFCDSCQLSVYNIAEMTPAQVQKMLSGPGGKFCGRIYRRADGTVLTKDCPTGLRALRKRTVRFAGATLSAILGLFSISYSQPTTATTSGADTVSVAPKEVLLRNTRSPLASGRCVITGTIFNVQGSPAADVEVSIFRAGLDRTNFKNMIRTRTDGAGNYVFDGLAAGDYQIETTLTDDSFSIAQYAQIADGEQLTLDIRLRQNYFVTGLVNIMPPPRKPTPPGTTIITREELDRMPHGNLF